MTRISPTVAVLMVAALGLTGHCIPDGYFVQVGPDGVVTETRDTVREDGTHHISSNTYQTVDSNVVIRGGISRPMTAEEKKVFEKEMKSMENELESMGNNLITSLNSGMKSLEDGMKSLEDGMKSLEKNLESMEDKMKF